MEWTTFSKTSRCAIFWHERVALGEFPRLAGINQRRLNHSAQMMKAEFWVSKAASEGTRWEQPPSPPSSAFYQRHKKNLWKREKVCWGEELARPTWLRSRDKWNILYPILGNLWGLWALCKYPKIFNKTLFFTIACMVVLGKNKGKGLSSRFGWLQGGEEKSCGKEDVTEGKISVRGGTGSSEDQEKSSLWGFPAMAMEGEFWVLFYAGSSSTPFYINLKGPQAGWAGERGAPGIIVGLKEKERTRTRELITPLCPALGTDASTSEYSLCALEKC